MFIENLPASTLLPLPQLGLIFIGIVVERHYVSRVTCFTNSLALVSHVGTIPDPGFLLATYAELGLVAGGVGIWFYLANNSLPDWYYLIALALFSGLPVASVILFQTQWLLALLVAAAVSVGLTAALPEDYRVAHMDSMPGAVYRYAEGRTIEHINRSIGYAVDIDLLEALKNRPR